MKRKIRSLRKILKDKEKTQRLATECETKPIYLWQIASGYRRPSVELAMLIEEKSLELFEPGWQVPKQELRPDVWKQSA